MLGCLQSNSIILDTDIFLGGKKMAECHVTHTWLMLTGQLSLVCPLCFPRIPLLPKLGSGAEHCLMTILIYSKCISFKISISITVLLHQLIGYFFQSLILYGSMLHHIQYNWMFSFISFIFKVYLHFG